MTYLQFLAVFVAIPILGLLLVLRRHLRALPWPSMAGLCLVALLYTAPWDNQLVINGVWTYSRQRVLGIVLGVVPLEEYAFFVLQTLLTSLLTLALIQAIPAMRTAPGGAAANLEHG